jgi:hypothetical protein
MNILSAIRSDFHNTATTSRNRHLYRTWTNTHPVLAGYPDAAAAINAASHRSPDSDGILNAFLTLAAKESLARYGIVEAFAPWIARQLASHNVPERERDDHAAVIVNAFIEASVLLGANAPYPWPVGMIIHAAENPIRMYYRRLDRIAEPAGLADDIEQTQLPLVSIRRNTLAITGEELALTALSNSVAAHTVSLADANLFARVLTGAATAAEQAPGLFISRRRAQQRVRAVADHLAATAA